jgi:superfamily II DNA or RNA helicase
MPISWRGTLAQYAGRLHRAHPAKREVIIFDYIDENEPTLARMAAKRRAGYRSLGYSEAAVAGPLTKDVWAPPQK